MSIDFISLLAVQFMMFAFLIMQYIQFSTRFDDIEKMFKFDESENESESESSESESDDVPPIREAFSDSSESDITDTSDSSFVEMTSESDTDYDTDSDIDEENLKKFAD